MAITNWKTLRISLLAVTLGAILLAGVNIFLYPPTGKMVVAAFEFPDSVPLPDWQFLESKPLAIGNPAETQAARKYLYQRNSSTLEIEMRYLVDTIAEVQSMVKKHDILKSSAVKPTIANAKGVGFYGVLQHQNRAYLNSCINPLGSSTFTSEQFRYNRNTYDVNFSRIVPWLLGRVRLQDRRCLWTQMSVPLQGTTPANANKILETAWVSWYQWWQPRFPKP